MAHYQLITRLDRVTELSVYICCSTMSSPFNTHIIVRWGLESRRAPHDQGPSFFLICKYHITASVYRPKFHIACTHFSTTYGNMNEWMKMKGNIVPSHVPVTLTDGNWKEVKDVSVLIRTKLLPKIYCALILFSALRMQIT